jgi:hypothetical protein
MASSVGGSANTTVGNTAFVLALVGVIFQGLGLLIVGVSMMFYGYGTNWWGMGMMGGYNPMMRQYPFYVGSNMSGLIWLVAASVIFVLSLYALLLMNSNNLNSVRTGAILLLIMAIVAFPTMWGLLIGSALMFAGAIIALTLRG